MHRYFSCYLTLGIWRLGLISCSTALVTFETIRNLTATTEFCNDRITDIGEVWDRGRREGQRVLGGASGVGVGGGKDGKREEIEDVSTR